MTNRWGPLGWMTLHSIAANYPDNPTQSDVQILSRFLECFRETISCPSCKGHFTAMITTYKKQHPEWANSKFDLFIAVCRLHNTVNRRLDKPRHATIQDCINTLITATSVNSPAIFRNSYIQYLISNWGPQQSGDGLIMMGAVREMMRINQEYWSKREQSYSDLAFTRDGDVLELVPESGVMYHVATGIPNFLSQPKKVGFRITGGKLRLGGK